MKPNSRTSRRLSSVKNESPPSSPIPIRSPTVESESERVLSRSFTADSPPRVRRTSSRLSNHSLTSPIPSPTGTPKRKRRPIRVKEEPESDEEGEVEEAPKKKKIKSEVAEKPLKRNYFRIADPNAPKRPRTAYVHFLSARRISIAQQHQAQKLFNSVLASEWKSLTNEERQVYIDMASKEKEEYDKSMETYKQTEEYAKFQEKKSLIKMERKKSFFANESVVVEKRRKKLSRQSEVKEENPKDTPLRDLEEEQASLKEGIQKLRREVEILHNRMRTGRRTQEILREVKPLNDEIQLLEKKNKRLAERIKTGEERKERLEDSASLWIEIVKKSLDKASIEYDEATFYSAEKATEFLMSLPASTMENLRLAMQTVSVDYANE